LSMTTEAPNSSPPRPRGWQEGLVWTIREEIDLGLIVRIFLPGAAQPMLVEEAAVEMPFVILSDPMGARYYIGSMAGIVLISQPIEGKGDGIYRPHAHDLAMTVDEDEPVAFFRRIDGKQVPKPRGGPIGL